MDKIQYEEEESSFINSIIDDFNLLLVTATKIEKDTLHSYLKPVDGRSGIIKIHKDRQTYYLGIFGKYNAVHVSCDNMGSTGRQASISTTIDAINYCKPKAVLMPGIAFGTGRPQRIGDVLVAETVIPYEVQRVSKGTNNIQYRGAPGAACSTMLNRFKHITNWEYKIRNKIPGIHIGGVFSGEKLIDNEKYKKQLMDFQPDAKGGEMEGMGIYTACDGKVNHWLVVKSICDWADGNKKKNKKANQRVAAGSAVDICHHVFNSPHAFKDIGLYPAKYQKKKIAKKRSTKKTSKVPTSKEIEKEIITEMKENTTAKLPSTINEFVRAFRSLDDQQKITIAKKIGVYVVALNSIYAHERDKEIFSRAQRNNVLSNLWEELNKISPFENATNPFTN
ncbi:MAG: hypothetical protein QM535_19575 [Limnohabitans sp.]|nr:hypothetical protein [Limnohabitans sp.]